MVCAFRVRDVSVPGSSRRTLEVTVDGDGAPRVVVRVVLPLAGARTEERLATALAAAILDGAAPAPVVEVVVPVAPGPASVTHFGQSLVGPAASILAERSIDR